MWENFLHDTSVLFLNEYLFRAMNSYLNDYFCSFIQSCIYLSITENGASPVSNKKV